MAKKDLVAEESARIGKQLAKLIETNLKTRLGNAKKVALLLSGGIDSTATGLAAHKLGYEVVAYTFQLGDVTSYDSKWAANTAKAMGWKFNLIQVPTDVISLMKGVRWLNLHAGAKKKVQYECGWPMLYVYKRIQEKFVLSGLNVDAFILLSRKAIVGKIAGPESKKDVYDAYREERCGPVCRQGLKAVTLDYNPSGMYQHLVTQRKFGLEDCNPWMQANVLDHFLKYTWTELVKPRQKHHIAGMYPEQIEKLGWRNHVNYQLGASVDDHFNLLLPTPLNFRQRRRTLDMYRDWQRDEATLRDVFKKLSTVNYQYENLPKTRTFLPWT